MRLIALEDRQVGIATGSRCSYEWHPGIYKLCRQSSIPEKESGGILSDLPISTHNEFHQVPFQEY